MPLPRSRAARRLAALPSGLAALGLAAVAGLAQAQNATTGAALYQQVIVTGQKSCAASACHGSSPAKGLNRISAGNSAYVLQSSVSSVAEMAFLSSHLSNRQFNDLAAYIAQVRGTTPTYLPVTLAPTVSLSASSLAFGSLSLGASLSKSLTLENTGNAALALSSLSSSQPTVFALSHDCPASLAAGSTCTLGVSFSPSSAGAHSASLTLASNASTSPDSVALSGTGISTAAAALGWSGGVVALGLADTVVGATSPAQTLTLQNTGSAPTVLASVALTGTDAAQFLQAGSCVAGLSLAAGQSCTVVLAFEPTASGEKSATLSVTASSAAAPDAVLVSATAVAPTTATSGNGNVGAGGCALWLPTSADAPPDPTLPALVLLAAGVLGRRWRARRATARPAPSFVKEPTP